jgi:hypothetical protein
MGDEAELRRDEASRRLGGPSRIADLEGELEALKHAVKTSCDELTEATNRLRVRVGAKLYAGHAPLNWTSEAGSRTHPAESCRIEGLGPDWVVVRSTTTDAIYFAASTTWPPSGPAVGDIRRHLGSHVEDF